ncbi:hypothetical protein PHMEG_00016058, partial [Phytophthora megakarya]
MCLQGPISSRKALKGLDELQVEVDGKQVVLLNDQARLTSLTTYNSQEHDAYKREKQRELAEALAKRSGTSEIEEMQQRLHEKTMARLKNYEQMDQVAFNKAKKK